MDVGVAITKRRSIRKFKSKSIDPEVLLELVDAARHAPSSGNIQPWKFILVKDQNKKNQIADACFQQLWMSEAPVIIGIVCLVEEVKRNYGIRGEAFYSIQDCAMAAQNILLKAEELGLGGCCVSAFEEGMMKRILGLEDGVRAQMLIPIGYSADEPNKKNLKTIESMTYFEGYGGRVESFDEAFYNWSGIMANTGKKILAKFKGGYSGIKDIISEKFKE